MKKTAKDSFLLSMYFYHKFFIKETPPFIGKLGKRWRIRKTFTTEIHEQYYPLTVSQKIKYPYAYIKFMWMCAKDWHRFKDSKSNI